MRYINSYENDAAIQAAVDSGELGKPYVALNTERDEIDWNSKEIDYAKMPLTLEILSDGNISWRASYSNSYTKTIEYSKNGGEWTEITTTLDETKIPVVSGDTVQFRGDNTQYGVALDNANYASFSGSTAQFNVYGNIMSLIYSKDFYGSDLPKNVPANFEALFRNTQVINAENLILPSKQINQITYLWLFANCKSLITAPKTIGDSETTIQQIGNCYALKDMFVNCTNLTTAPVLPAFLNPNNYCFEQMFKGCTNLNYIKCLATTYSSDYYLRWVDGVSSTGTFVKKAGVTWPSGASGIPSGWTVVEE